MDDKAFLGIFTGNDPTGNETDGEHVKQAVAERFLAIRDRLVERSGAYVYNGNRCKPSNLGWRFIQSYGTPEVEEILNGRYDSEIEANWHESAAAEHWYKYEKSWD